MLKLLWGAAKLAGYGAKSVAKGAWWATKTGGKMVGTQLFSMQDHFNMKTQLVGLGLSMALGALITPQNRVGGALTEAGFWVALAGARNPYTQILGSIGLSLATASPGIGKGIANAYVGGVNARTSASIPFSHSNMAMDAAMGQFQYAQSRMNELGSPTEGTEAMFFAAKMAR